MNQPIRSRLSQGYKVCKSGVVHVTVLLLLAGSASALLIAQIGPPAAPTGVCIVTETAPCPNPPPPPPPPPPPSGPNPIAPARLPDGSTAIPNPAWSTAGATITHRTTRCGSVIPAGSSVATVNSAIANCPAGQYVELAAGNFTFGGSINMKNNVTLRGQGPNATLITMTGGGCVYGSSVCFGGSFGNYMNNPQNISGWTGGFTKGTSTITLANAGTLQVGMVVHLDEVNSGLPDPYPNLWYCLVVPTCVVNVGNDGEGGGTRNGRLHNHEAVVIAKNGNNVTISPALFENFSSGKTPQATWGNATGTGIGVEEFSINSNSTGWFVFEMLNTTNSWVRHVRSINPTRSHAMLSYAIRNTISDSYFFRTASHATTSYGLEFEGGSANLVENNILQWITAPLMVQGGNGNVFGYNYIVNAEYSDAASYMFAGGWTHAGGTDFNLFEGNDMSGFDGDIQHGAAFFTTLFRNHLWGRERSAVDATNSVIFSALVRFQNVVGNVMGIAGYHTQYECYPGSCANENLSIYAIGSGYSGSTGPAGDIRVRTTLFRWGNWDVVTSSSDNGTNDQTGTRWNSSEVPSAIPGLYANPVPSTQTLPLSMYRSSKPSFFKTSDPWPPIGPDISGGTIASVGGHVRPIPARQCYLNLMGGSPTGTTVLPFTCNYPLP